jgi:hypothetical protein
VLRCDVRTDRAGPDATVCGVDPHVAGVTLREILEVRRVVDLFVCVARHRDVEIVHLIDDESRRTVGVDEAQPPDAHAVPARLRMHVRRGPVVDLRDVTAERAALAAVGVALVRTDAEPLDALDALTEIEPDADARDVVEVVRDRDGVRDDATVDARSERDLRILQRLPS